MPAPLLTLPECDFCPESRPLALYAAVDGRRFCVACWKRVGRPFPRNQADPVELANLEGKTRQRMLERGGAHRYAVRSGKA